MMDKQIKNFPENPHMEYHCESHGWIYLGSDDSFDYYINHENRWTSKVFGDAPDEYISEHYDTIDPETWPANTTQQEIQ